MNEETPIPRHGEVRAELQRILRSPELSASRQLSLLLYTTVEAAIRGFSLSAYELGRVLGRSEDWDPSTDTTVRTNMGILRKKLETYANRIGKLSHVQIELPSGSLAATYRYNPDSPYVSDSPLTSFGLSFFSALHNQFDITGQQEVRCVVTGSLGTWHYLDGNPYHNSLGNVIPLAESLHVHLDGMRDGKIRTGRPELDPNRLAEETAPGWFRNLQSARAYGCANLAFHLGLPPYGYEAPEIRVRRLRDALYYARNCFSEHVIADLIRSGISLLSNIDTIDAVSAYRLSLELTALTMECRYFEYSHQFLEMAMFRLEKPYLTILRDSGSFHPLVKLRRRAQLIATQTPEDPTFERPFREAQGLSTDENGAVVMALVSAARSLRIGSRSAAENVYEDLAWIVEKYQTGAFTGENFLSSRGLTAANLSEALICRAIAVCRLQPNGWEESAAESFEAAHRLLQASGHRPSREFWEFAAPTFNRRAGMYRFNFTEADVRPRQQVDLRQDIGGILSCLSRQRITAKN